MKTTVKGLFILSICWLLEIGNGLPSFRGSLLGASRRLMEEEVVVGERTSFDLPDAARNLAAEQVPGTEEDGQPSINEVLDSGRRKINGWHGVWNGWGWTAVSPNPCCTKSDKASEDEDASHRL